MPNLSRLHNRLQKISEKLDVNFRQLRFQNIVLSPNPRVKSKAIGNSNRSTATSYPVSKEGFEGFQIFFDIIGLSNSGIDPTIALQPASIWEISEDGVTFFEIVLYNKAIRQSSRWIATFIRRLADANLIIKIPTQTGGSGIDIDGNLLANTAVIELTCAMGQSRNVNSNASIPGVSPGAIKLSGRCLSPLTIPSSLKSLRQYEASLIDNNSNVSVTGRFIPTPTAPEIWTPDSRSQGSLIEGWFSLRE